MENLYPEASYGLDCSVELGDLTPLEHDILSRLVPELGNSLIINRLSGKSAKLHGLKGLNRRLHLFGMHIKSLPSYTNYCKHFYKTKKRSGLDLLSRSKELMALKICHEFSGSIMSSAASPQTGLAFETVNPLQDKKQALYSLPEERIKNSVADSKLIKIVQNSDSLLRLRLEINTVHSAKSKNLECSLRQEILSTNWALALEEPEFSLDQSNLIINSRNSILFKNKKAIINFKKSAIKKTCKLFNLCGQESSLRLFISNSSLEIYDPNSTLMVELKKNKKLLHEEISAHKELDFILYDTQNGTKTKIANYCVYLENAPTLDQVLGFKLLIDSGDLPHVLEKGNAYDLNKSFIVSNKDRLPLPPKVINLAERVWTSSNQLAIETNSNILKGNYGLFKKDIEKKLVAASLVKSELQEAFEFLKNLLSLDDSFNKKLFLGYLGLSRLDPIDEKSLTLID